MSGSQAGTGSRELFERHVPFLELLGVTPKSGHDGRAEFELTVDGKHLRTFGMLHGGVVATLLDTAMGYAAVTKAPADHLVVTMQLNMNFTRAAKPGDRLLALGEVVHAGGRTAVTRGEIRSAAGTLIATGSATFFFIEKPASK